MKNKLCPQCQIRRFNVKNDKGESIVVTLTNKNEVIPIKEGQSLEGFNLDELFCLGCSWKGSPTSLI